MYKFIIVSVNAKFIHTSLAASYLLSSLNGKLCGEEFVIGSVESTINEAVDAVYKRIADENANAVGFSCYIWNIEFILSLAKRLKEEHPGVAVILGGPEVSFNSCELLKKHEFIDYILCGEGEEALPELLECLKEERNIPQGLCTYRDGQEMCLGRLHKLSCDPLEPFCGVLPGSLQNKLAYMESSRGCPFSCAFCLSGEKGNVRFFSLERVKRDILTLASSGAQTIKFVDRTFNCNKSRAQEILLFIKENFAKAIPENVCFHFEIAADILDTETLSVIGSMPPGSVQFEAGIQSFNPKTLESVRRKTDLSRLEENLKTLISFKNCHVHIDLIFGLPYEDYESVKKSFDRAFALGANMLQLGFLKVLHGSALKEKAKEYEIIYSEKPPYEVISTEWLCSDELKRLHKIESVFDRIYNSGRFKRTLRYVLSESGLSPFELFEKLSGNVETESSMPLDVFTEKCFGFFLTLPGIDKMRLRDEMITDRIATNASGIIPKCLQVKDSRLKNIKHFLAEKYPPEKGEMRTLAVLYTYDEVVFSSHRNKNSVSGEYELIRIKMKGAVANHQNEE
ncbi:MAG: DUF4080 domain-containing protein [Acutalibacteraceae bacterium]